jgi:hypothetical protein
VSAKASTLEKSPPVPRPPETTMAASVSSGRPDFSLGLRSVIARRLGGVGSKA